MNEWFIFVTVSAQFEVYRTTQLHNAPNSKATQQQAAAKGPRKLGLLVKQQPLLSKELSYCEDGWNIRADVRVQFEENER